MANNNLNAAKEGYENIILYRKYNPEDYPRYDNYDAIEVKLARPIIQQTMPMAIWCQYMTEFLFEKNDCY